jgi:Protein of unknown function (DUF3738)
MPHSDHDTKTIPNRIRLFCLGFAKAKLVFPGSYRSPLPIQATTPESVSNHGRKVYSNLAGKMTQTLLAERFKLALHRESRQLPI